MKWDLKWILARRQEANRLRAVSLRPAEDSRRSREQEDVDLWCNCWAVRNHTERKCSNVWGPRIAQGYKIPYGQ